MGVTSSGVVAVDGKLPTREARHPLGTPERRVKAAQIHNADRLQTLADSLETLMAEAGLHRPGV
jgi:hypothetical protein